MEKKLKVFLKSGLHSPGRGVGFYAQFLSQALGKIPEITLTGNNPDIIHYPFFDLFYSTLPFYKTTPTVVTIHDLTPLVLAKRYPRGVRGSIAFLRQYLSLKSVRAVITDSENSKTDIGKFLHFPGDRIFVIPLAVDPVFTKKISEFDLKIIGQKYELPDKFVLCVSAGPNPNKNLPSLASVTQNLGIPLVLVGKGLLQEVKEPVHPELADLVDLKKYKHVIYLGFVPTEDLNALYKLSSIYCQPSLYEGFGLPILEAMTSGALVVCSNTSSFPEVYPKNTITFNPNDLVDMEQQIKNALNLSTTERNIHILAGQSRSLDFNWDKTAQYTVKVYKEVMSQ